jgi:hypothetical protein
LNPINTSVNQVDRVWADTDLDLVPDCDLANFAANGECGAINNANFGRPNVTTRWSEDVLQGFYVRPGNWDYAIDVQHQLGGNVSINAGYNRTWANNFRVTDNVEVEPTDFDPFCITAPTHSDLPNGGGYQVCGLYDVTPAKFGRVNNVVRPASDFGKQQRVSNFFNINVDTRFASGLLVRGGIDSGITMTDQCFVVDSPQGTTGTGIALAATSPGRLNCRISPPLMGTTQIKLQGSYPLPREFSVALIYQNVPSVPYEAVYRATNREIFPSLGRNLAACGPRTLETCTATVNVPLVVPGTFFEDRRSQMDFRLTKNIQVTSGMKLQANLDVYNIFNSGALLTTNVNFGPAWRNPTEILDGRLFQVSGQLTW